MVKMNKVLPAMDKSEIIDSMLDDFHKTLSKVSIGSLHMNGPVKQSIYTKLAELYWMKKDERMSVYYLCEAQATTLRYDWYLTRGLHIARENIQNGILEDQDLGPAFESFEESNMHFKQYSDLVDCLKEMPSEWTLVQLSREHSAKDKLECQFPGKVFSPTKLHLIRYQCGKNYIEPIHTVVSEIEGASNGAGNLMELLEQATGNIDNPPKGTTKRTLRAQKDEQLKKVVEELQTCWLRGWSSLMLGHLSNKALSKDVCRFVEETLGPWFEQKEDSIKHMIYQMALNGGTCGDRSKWHAITHLPIENETHMREIFNMLKNIQKRYPNLTNAKRHPVILILDENLAYIPWESINALKNHPVSRVASVHIARDLYKRHKNALSGGKVMINDPLRNGFYVLDPDENLASTREKMKAFYDEKTPFWNGVVGRTPKKDEIIKALRECALYVYSGHGNGTHFLSSVEIARLNDVKAIPLLVGCCSVRPIASGGRVHLHCVANNYLQAGSACVLGMLWSVTSTDADKMTIELLSNWLPGLKQSDYDGNELDLLRFIQTARESSSLFLNGASLVYYGLPVCVA